MLRKQKHKRLRADGDRTLVGTKYVWLESTASMRPERKSLLSQLNGTCTCMGAEGGGLSAVELRLHRLGAQGMARVGGAWLAEQARADGVCGARGQDPTRWDPERGGAKGDERRGGVDERRDPADQADGMRIQEPRALPERSPLPPPGGWTSIRGCVSPHESLKRQREHLPLMHFTSRRERCGACVAWSEASRPSIESA
jgi:hypothetical protein